MINEALNPQEKLEFNTPFRQTIEPVIDLIIMVFEMRTKQGLEPLYYKYGETLMINENSKEEFSELMKESVNEVYSLMSEQIIQTIYNNYFSDGGLEMYIFYIINQFSMEFLGINTT